MEIVEHRNSYSLSVLLHLAILLIAAFGIPRLLPKKAEPTPLVMSIDIMPITSVTNVKPSDKPIQEEKKAPAVENKKPVPPTIKEPPKPVEQPKPVEPPKPVEKTFDPMAAEPLPTAKPKPKEEKKPDQPKENPQKLAEKARDAAFLKQLNNIKLDAADPKKDAKDTTTQVENKTKSDAPYNPTMPLGLSEQDAIRGQIEKCWSKTSFMGAPDPKSLVVVLHIVLSQDGSVQLAEMAPSQSYRNTSDRYFQAAAGAAMRAAHECSPLKNLPPDKYDSWREFNLNFNPADLM